MVETFKLFLESSDIWGGAVAAGAITGAVCGFLGVYVVLNRMVFVSAALAQISSLGVMLAFWISSHSSAHETHVDDTAALLLGIGFAVAFSIFLVRARADLQVARVRSSESIIGFAYIVSSAGVVLLGDRVSQGAHDVANLLFGNAVIVDGFHLALLACLTLPFLALHIWLFKDVFFVSYDATTAKTMGYPVRFLQLFLLLTFGIVISIATRTIGALPVFAFSTLPAMFALAIFENIYFVFAAATLMGVLSAVGGYAASFMLSFPTGACMSAFGGMALVAALLAKRLLRR